MAIQPRNIDRRLVCGLWWALLPKIPDLTKTYPHPHTAVGDTTLARSNLPMILSSPTIEQVTLLIQSGVFSETECNEWFELFRAEVCAKCPYRELEDQWVGSSYSGKDNDPKFILVGQAPGADEVEDGRPFVGPAGKYLWKRLGEIGIVRGEVYITNSVKCRPPKDAEPTAEALACCSPLLKLELEQLPNQLIIVAGKVAVRATTHLKTFRIDDYAGGLIESPDNQRRIFVLKHPAAVLRSGSLWIDRQYREHVSQLQKILSQGSSNHVFSSFEIVDSLEKLREFEEIVQRESTYAIDIETNGLTFDAEILSVALSNSTNTWTFPIVTHSYLVDHLKRILPTLKLIAHNAMFDISMVNYIWDLDCDVYWDTMQFQHLLDEEGELGLNVLAVRIVNAPPGFKEKGDRFWRIKDLETHLRTHPEELKTFLEYNAADAYYTYKIYQSQMEHPEYKHVLSFYNTFTLPVLNMFIDINKYGVPIDVYQMVELNKQFSQFL